MNIFKVKPFMDDCLEISESIFLKSSYPSKYKIMHNSNLLSFGNNKSPIKSIQATVGESIEREHLFNNGNENTLKAFNMADGNILDIEITDILLNLSLRSMQGRQPLYADTCGVATHLVSDMSINSALFEFIERQSLIMSWLLKYPGQRLSIDHISKDNLLENLEGYEIYINDISMWEAFKVVLVVGVNENERRFVVGCCSHKEVNKAVKGALSEASIIAHYYEVEGFNNNKGMNISHIEDGNNYANYYYSLSFNELKEKYDYIMKNSNYRKVMNNDEDLCKEDIKSLGIDVYCTYVPAFNNENFKTVKVFSPDAFPHMNTKILNPNEYKISQVIANAMYPNIYQPMPFP